MDASQYINRLIKEGEHQQLDFKFEVSDSKKIARTFSAFSNTDGGKLLVGVKDNGAIAGVRSEEEFFMLEAAATMYCRPPVHFSSNRWVVNGKVVLEIDVPKSENMPHTAPDKSGKYMAYVRVDDQNLLANSVLLKVWKNKKNKEGILVKYTETEKLLLHYLKIQQTITLAKFRKIARIPNHLAVNILAKYIVIGLIDLHLTEKGAIYTIKQVEQEL